MHIACHYDAFVQARAAARNGSRHANTVVPLKDVCAMLTISLSGFAYGGTAPPEDARDLGAAMHRG